MRHDGTIVGALCIFDNGRRRIEAEKTRRYLERIARRVDAETGLRHLLATRSPLDIIDVNDVVATVSHEIRTPLTAIRGYAEMLADTSLASAYVSQLAAIDRNSLRLCRTVDTLLRALNQQRNKPAGNRQVVDLATLAKAAAAEVGPSNSRIRYEMPARPIEVYADRRLLEVAVGHLLSNALNFSDVDQPVTVTIGDRHGPAIQVHDNGPGLDESELSRLGAPFFRGTYAHRHELPGVGLGLAVTEHIVRAQGASLHFSSPPGGGLTAQILFS